MSTPYLNSSRRINTLIPGSIVKCNSLTGNEFPWAGVPKIKLRANCHSKCPFVVHTLVYHVRCYEDIMESGKGGVPNQDFSNFIDLGACANEVDLGTKNSFWVPRKLKGVFERFPIAEISNYSID